MSNRQVSECKTFPHKVFLQTVVFALNSPAVMIGVTKLFLLAFAVQSFSAGAVTGQDFDSSPNFFIPNETDTSESTIEALNSPNTTDSTAEPMSTDSSNGMSTDFSTGMQTDSSTAVPTSSTLEEYIPENNTTSDDDGEPDYVYDAQIYVIDEDMSDNGTFVPHYRKNITIHREMSLRVDDDEEEMNAIADLAGDNEKDYDKSIIVDNDDDEDEYKSIFDDSDDDKDEYKSIFDDNDDEEEEYKLIFDDSDDDKDEYKSIFDDSDDDKDEYKLIFDDSDDKEEEKSIIYDNDQDEYNAQKSDIEAERKLLMEMMGMQ